MLLGIIEELLSWLQTVLLHSQALLKVFAFKLCTYTITIFNLTKSTRSLLRNQKDFQEEMVMIFYSVLPGLEAPDHRTRTGLELLCGPRRKHCCCGSKLFGCCLERFHDLL